MLTRARFSRPLPAGHGLQVVCRPGEQERLLPWLEELLEVRALASAADFEALAGPDWWVNWANARHPAGGSWWPAGRGARPVRMPPTLFVVGAVRFEEQRPIAVEHAALFLPGCTDVLQARLERPAFPFVQRRVTSPVEAWQAAEEALFPSYPLRVRAPEAWVRPGLVRGVELEEAVRAARAEAGAAELETDWRLHLNFARRRLAFENLSALLTPFRRRGAALQALGA